MRKVKTIAFETEAKRLYLLAKEILYIQAEGHDCHVHTISGDEYAIRLTMAQCARIIDESTNFKSDFVLLGRNLIINYSRLGRCVFNDAEIPLRKAKMTNGSEEIETVKCQTQAWKRFLNLLEKGEDALTQYQADKRQEYKSVNTPSSCSLIGLMTTASATKLDFYDLKNNDDFHLLGGCNLTPMYSEGSMDSELAGLTNWANETVDSVNKTIRRQPTKLVDCAFEPNGEPEFDIVLSYEEYWTTSPIAKPSERLKALQKKFNEFYESNLQKIISDSENKNGNEKTENLESLGLYDFIHDMRRVSQEISQQVSGYNHSQKEGDAYSGQGDHPSYYCSRPLGLYRYKGRNGRPEIVLFLKNIYDAKKEWCHSYGYDKQLPTLNELVTLTYIHELMHAIMRSPTSYAYIEEPLAEMGMLCFVHDVLCDKGLEGKAKHWVKQKQRHEPICHYGFGAFLYGSLNKAEVGWGVSELMKQYIKVNKRLSDNDAALADYEDYFLGGYPWHNLQLSALHKLFDVLDSKKICHSYSKKEETIFVWKNPEYIRAVEPAEQAQQRDTSNMSDDEVFFTDLGYDIDEEVTFHIPDFYDCSPESIEKALNYRVNLGFKLDEGNNCTRVSSRHCRDIYLDYLLKNLPKEEFRKEVFGIDCSDSEPYMPNWIELTKTASEDQCKYQIKVSFK